MIPEGWKSEHLADLSAVPITYGVVKPGPHDDEGGVLFVRGGDFPNGKIDPLSLRTITQAVSKQYRRTKLCGGEILVSLVGYPGACAVVQPELAGANIARQAAIIRLKDPAATSYVAAYLRSPLGQAELLSNTIGSAQQVINLKDLRTITVPVPPDAERNKIADILSTWDQTIEAVEALIANAREQKTALMQALLTGRTRLPAFDGEWTWSKFSDVFERVRDKNIVGDTNVLTISAQRGLISQTEYFNKVVASDDVRGYTLLRRGDFAYNKSYSDGYPFGAFKPLDRYDQGIVSSLYICFRLTGSGHDHDFMRHYFEAGLFNREVAAIAQEGARNHGLLNVSVVDFFDTSLHTPPRDEQVAIAAVINDAERRERMLTEQRDALREEKTALMQQLLTGKRLVKTAEGEDA